MKDEGCLYRVQDTVAEKWGPTIEYPNDAVAKRGFAMWKVPPYAQKGDFALVRIGTRVDMELTSCDPEVIAVNEVPSEQSQPI